jgi:2-succinyl-6-hydroxy-2,4-cyclohexadiene-1-carboxylate synthase
MITIKIPVLLISGKKDHKYQLIQEQMSECLSNSITGTIKGAGHNTHLEKPKEFIKLVKSFIDNIS